MAIKYRTLSPKQYNLMKKIGYIERGLDGRMRGLFLTKKGTTSIPVKVKRKLKQMSAKV